MLRLAILQSGGGQADPPSRRSRPSKRNTRRAKHFRRPGSNMPALYINGSNSIRRKRCWSRWSADGQSGDGRQPTQQTPRTICWRSSIKPKRPAEALKLLDAMEPSASADWQPKIELARAASLIATEQFAPAGAALEAYLQTRPGDEYAGPGDRSVGRLLCHDANTGRRPQKYGQLSRGAVGSRPRRRQAARANRASCGSRPRSKWPKRRWPPAKCNGPANCSPRSRPRKSAEYIVRGLSGLGWCQLEANQPEKAAATFDRLLEKFPDSESAAEAAWARGQSLERLKQFDAALASYQLILDKYPTSPRFVDAMLAAARLHDQLHQPAQAIELYQRFLADHRRRRRWTPPAMAWAGPCGTPAAEPNRTRSFKKSTTIFAQAAFGTTRHSASPKAPWPRSSSTRPASCWPS